MYWCSLCVPQSAFFCSNMSKRIPVIGRKELDLHILYAEVTHRGGYEKVRLLLIPSALLLIDSGIENWKWNE